MQDQAPSRIGVGIYTFPEASRLTGVPVSNMRRWTTGYSYRRSGEIHTLPPIVKPQLHPIDGALALTFLDLQEVRFLHAFRKHGVSWQTLRVAHERARARLRVPHPFATGRFKTDGRAILVEVAHERGDPALEDIVARQLSFKRVLAPYLKGLEFAGDLAARWFPVASRRVVIDPARSFGQPIVQEGVPTLVLAKTFAAEGSYPRVARWYDVDVRSVRAAVDFEHQLAA